MLDTDQVFPSTVAANGPAEPSELSVTVTSTVAFGSLTVPPWQPTSERKAHSDTDLRRMQSLRWFQITDSHAPVNQ